MLTGPSNTIINLADSIPTFGYIEKFFSGSAGENDYWFRKKSIAKIVY
jgi:hypothetical protein